MPLRIIAYDLYHRGEFNYDDFYELIHSHNYVMLTPSCYALPTEESPEDLKARARKVVHEDDSIVTGTLTDLCGLYRERPAKAQ